MTILTQAYNYTAWFYYGGEYGDYIDANQKNTEGMLE